MMFVRERKVNWNFSAFFQGCSLFYLWTQWYITVQKPSINYFYSTFHTTKIGMSNHPVLQT